MTDLLSAWRARPLAAFLIAAGALAAIRVTALFFADADLGPDEAQYWNWGETLAFGYFSKPPLIAWTIAATTSVFGDAEWAVRLAAPLYHFGAAVFLFALARRLYDESVAFWAGIGWLTLPGVTLSSTLMTTDAPLLFFWSAALYFFFALLRSREQGKSGVAAATALGMALGLGFLAKYAMIYFLIGAGLAFLLARGLRRHLKWSDAALALLIAAAIISPNALWNAQNDFQTLSHTAANANWGAGFFHVDNFLEFLAAQFGVFGPAPLLLLIWGMAAAFLRKNKAADSRASRLAVAGAQRDRDIALLAFVLPPIVIIAVQALLSRAHANWAAVAYPSAIVLVTAWAFRARIALLAKASVVAHTALAIGFIAAFANFAIIDALGLSNAVKRVRGWEEQGAFVREAAQGYDAILVDDRELMASLLYYARGGPPIVARDSNNHIDSHYEAFMAYDPAKAPRVLFVDINPDGAAVAGHFAHVAPAGTNIADLKRGRKRALFLFEASGYGEKPAAD